LYINKSITKLEPLDINIILYDNFKVITLSELIGFSKISPRFENDTFLLGTEFEVFRGMEHGRKGDLLKCPYCKKYFEKPGKINKKLKKIECKSCKKEILINQENSYSFIKSKKEGDDFRPLLIGNSIDRYKLKNIGYYIQINLDGIDYKNLNEIDEKILLIRISKDFRCYYDTDKMICLNALNVICKKGYSQYDLKYIIGILNSKLYKSYADFKITSGAELTIRLSNDIMRSIPIKKINFSDFSKNQSHNQIVSLVDQMLEEQKKYHSAKTEKDETFYKREIDRLDNEIDRLVYQLYELTPEEIAIVEESVKK